MVKARFNRFLILVITALCVLYSTQSSASLQAQVDRNPVAVNESFNLTLQSSDNSSGEPDLSALKRDFDILGQSKSSSFQIINGQISHNTQWQISLTPKHAGQLQIPAISLGGQSSPPVSLTVTAASQADTAQQSKNLFVEVSAEPQTVHVQQQIIFTVRLYSALSLGDGSNLSDPEFPKMDAVVERLGTDRPFQVVRNGQAYSVIERRYAVFPQKSGQFNSSPVVFDGSVVEENQGGGGFMFNPFSQSTRHLRLNSKTIAFSVKPVPAGFDSSQWLPASKLQLEEQWSENPPKFTVGEPITRTLTITANGLTASQLPALDSSKIDGLKLYPDQPTLKDSQDGNGIVGTREQKIAFIPTRPGNVTLPAIEIKWWNVNTDKEEVARLPARSISILPGSPNQVSAPPPTPTTPTTEAPVPSALPTNASQAPGTSIATVAPGWWPWLSLLLGTGWLITLLAWWWQSRKKSSLTETNTAHEETLGQLEKQFKKACLANDASEAKTQLLAWAKQRWRQNPPASLTALARLCEPSLADAVTQLDRALYAQTQAHWQGDALWQLFSQHKPVDIRIKTENSDALEPLYRSS
ncbi:MAG TPA: BatD family protein [Sulfuriferula sp.]|nr:BatD family protein [Sulfuriferula sp.]